MSSVNKGGQIITFSYGERAEAFVFNTLLHKVIPVGIYSGGLLSKANDTTVHISPFVSVISDSSGDISVRLQTTTTYDLSGGTPLTPFVVITYNWVSETANYGDFVWKAEVDIEENDLVIGRANFTGAILDGTFDYSERDEAGFENVTNDAQLKIASNLSDVADVSTSRTNLGLGTGDVVEFKGVTEDITNFNTSVTTTYTILDDDPNMFAVDTTTGSFTFTLPTLADNIGRRIYLINISEGNSIFFEREGADVIGPTSETSVEASSNTTILIGTPDYWSVVETGGNGGGGGASTTDYTSAMDIDTGQPLAVLPGSYGLDITLATGASAFDAPVTAYFVIQLANNTKVMVYFVTDTATSAPNVGQDLEFQIQRASFATDTDVSNAVEDLIGHFGIYAVSTAGGVTTIEFANPDGYVPSFYQVGSTFTDNGSATVTDRTGEAIVASSEFRYSAEVVGIANAAATAGATVTAQKVALFESIPATSLTTSPLEEGLPVFLGRGGTLTQDVEDLRVKEFRTYLGVATATDAVDILIGESVEINDAPYFYDTVPIGAILFSSTTTLPDGYLRPQGQAVSRSTYSELNDLYNAESYPHGNGDGSTTFNLPNYVDPMAMIKVLYVNVNGVTTTGIDGGSA